MRLDGAEVYSQDVGPLCAPDETVIEVAVSVLAGDHLVSASIDPRDAAGANPLWGLVFESDETNNEATHAFTIEAPAAPPPSGGGGGGEIIAASGGGVLVLALIALIVAGASVAGFVWWRRRRRGPETRAE